MRGRMAFVREVFVAASAHQLSTKSHATFELLFVASGRCVQGVFG